MTYIRNIRAIWFVPTNLQHSENRIMCAMFYQDSFETAERTHGQSAMARLT